MNFFLILLLTFSFNNVFAQSSEELITIEEPQALNISQPLMSCAMPGEEPDFINITFMTNLRHPNQGSIVAIRNPEHDDQVVESVLEEGPEYSNFNLSPVSMISHDLRISQSDKEGMYQISGGLIGLYELPEQMVDSSQARAQLRVKSSFGGVTIVLNCSVYPDSFESAFWNQ